VKGDPRHHPVMIHATNVIINNVTYTLAQELGTLSPPELLFTPAVQEVVASSMVLIT
jgi:hypothetical protein